MHNSGTPQAPLPSLRDLPPLEDGGRIQRKGASYQDHIGASFCLDMLETEDLVEVWFERHDDIVLVWRNSSIEEFEFVQVKHEDQDSRYSISSITRRKYGKVGTSLVERSLNRSCCREATRFRIVTSFDVQKALYPLKSPLGSQERKQSIQQLQEIGREINLKLPEINSAKDGTTIEQWTQRCYWDKRPDTIKSIKNENLLKLEKLFLDIGHFVLLDQREEAYKSLIALVRELSGASEKSTYRLSEETLKEWLDSRVHQSVEGTAYSENLKRKLKKADLSSYIPNALDLLRSYRLALLRAPYTEKEGLQEAEQEVTASLNLLRSKLDTGQVSGGRAFHNRCLEAIEVISERLGGAGKEVSTSQLQGYMYFRTNRCVHQFTEVEP